MAIHRENEDEIEEESLIVGTTTPKVIEYLEPLMSIELLCKFPDNSAYDFDYSQSTIWSPLAPRPFSPMDLSLLTPTNLSYDHEIGTLELGVKTSTVKKVGSKLRKKSATTAFNLNLDLFKTKRNKNKNKKMMASDLSPRIKSTCNPIIAKGWARVLKAASKQFKRRKMKKDPTAYVMLPKCLRDADV